MNPPVSLPTPRPPATVSSPQPPPPPASSSSAPATQQQRAPSQQQPLQRRRRSRSTSPDPADQQRKKPRIREPAGPSLSVPSESPALAPSASDSPAMVGSDVPIPGPPPLASASTSTLGNGHTLAPAVGVGGHLPSSSAAVGNGHAATNGFSSSSNGTVTRTTDAMQYDGDEGFVPLWDGSNLDRREFVRLALQAFEDMGYRCVPRLAGSFRAQLTSSCPAQGNGPYAASRVGFRARVARRHSVPPVAARGTMDRRRATSCRATSGRPHRPDCTLSRFFSLARSLAVQLTCVARVKPVHFAIRQQKFLEALEGRETKKALSVLRNELSPLGYDSNRLHFLSR